MVSKVNKEFLLVKFPILFPLLYISILYIFPSFETQLIFITILLLAETHFGATWPFFLNKVSFNIFCSKYFSCYETKFWNYEFIYKKLHRKK